MGTHSQMIAGRVKQPTRGSTAWYKEMDQRLQMVGFDLVVARFPQYQSMREAYYNSVLSPPTKQQSLQTAYGLSLPSMSIVSHLLTIKK